MKNTIRNISVVLLVIAAGAMLIVPKLLSDKNKSVNPTGQNQQNQSVPADVYVVVPVELDNEISTTGTVFANEEVEIRSELSRKVTGIYFSEGTFVSAGKLLFKLDDSDLLVRLNKLNLDFDLSGKQEEREKQLLDKGLLSQDDYDIRLTGIEKIRADIEVLENEISKTEITAPFSGITGFRNVSIGSLVNSSVVLTTIQDIGRVKIDFPVPEKYSQLFSRGMDLTFTAEGNENEFSAKVISYDPKVNESTRTITLRAVTSNSGNKLLPGSFVKVKLKLEKSGNVVMVPTESIIPKLKGQSVFLFRNGIAELVDVSMGIRTETNIEITSGINPGDTLIITNILRLKQGSKVKIENVK